MTHLQLFELLQDHVVGHVVKEAISGSEDDVTQLHVKGGTVGGIRAAQTHIFHCANHDYINYAHKQDVQQKVMFSWLELRMETHRWIFGAPKLHFVDTNLAICFNF